MDHYQNLEYDFYPKLEYRLLTKSKVWIIIKI